MAVSEATLTIRLESEEAVRSLEDILKRFDIVKKARELEFAVSALEREVHKTNLRLARIEDLLSTTHDGWQA